MVDKQFCGVWIDLVGDFYFEQQVQKMSEMGGKFAGIRITDQAVEGIAIPTFDLPLAYRTLAAAMPVQMLAYQTGVRRGEVPGEMRYLNWVVK
jgi:fructoselysine-6-P-deglycase FrlB-like protein